MGAVAPGQPARPGARLPLPGAGRGASSTRRSPERREPDLARPCLFSDPGGGSVHSDRSLSVGAGVSLPLFRPAPAGADAVVARRPAAAGPDPDVTQSLRSS